jgi:hypothetical protein
MLKPMSSVILQFIRRFGISNLKDHRAILICRVKGPASIWLGSNARKFNIWGAIRDTSDPMYARRCQLGVDCSTKAFDNPLLSCRGIWMRSF